MPEDASPSYSLDLLRAELTAALAQHTLGLIDRFASKADVVHIQTVFAEHEKQDVVRFDALQTQLGKAVAFQNRIAGALALALVVVPILTAIVVHFLG